jgi:peroxiredoxin
MRRFTQTFIALFLFTGLALAQGYEIGDKVEDFELKSTDGEMVSMSDYEEAEGYIIIFTCNHCPFAKAYEDRIKEIHEDFAPQYPVIAINPNDPEIQPDDSFEKMKERAEAQDFNFKYLFDGEQKVFPKFGATRTPHVFIVDNNMKLRYIGAIDDNYKSAEDVEKTYLRDAVEALKNGNDPDPEKTKAIGCTIKTAK